MVALVIVVFGFSLLSTVRGADVHYLDLSTQAACLDGSPYAFYLQQNTSSTRWTIFIQGGGWSYNETLSYYRSKTRLGTSTVWSNTSECDCMYVHEDGSTDNTCNCVYMPYCDGASFSGYREDPWPVNDPTVPSNATLHFRGQANLKATLQTLFDKYNFASATELVVTGDSAGGLSTFLHSDRIGATLKARAPNARVSAAPVVGYFLDLGNEEGTDNNYHNWMEYIYNMQNISGFLHADCLQANADAPFKCFIAPHMVQYVATPFFMFNSRFDYWQLQNILQVPCMKNETFNCTDSERQAILKYGDDFLAQFAIVPTLKGNGAFITSCICHGCAWNVLTLADSKLNSMAAFGQWYSGAASSNIYIDQRGPNGDGAITNRDCEPW